MIRGIWISDYRSFGEAQHIAPLGKINLFVGPNNSGKSNVLRFIQENLRKLLRNVQGRNRTELTSHPHVQRRRPTQGGVNVPLSFSQLEAILQPHAQNTARLVEKMYAAIAPDNSLWIDDEWPHVALRQEAVHWGSHGDWYELWSPLAKQRGGGLHEHWIPETLHFLRRLAPSEATVYSIPINRHAGGAPEESPNAPDAALALGGNGVIRALAALQNPAHENFDRDRKRFDAVEDFVRVVTDDPTARISVTHKQDEILVQMKGQPFFPLASLGSGIEQVVLHAVAATTAQNGVVAFEEPELHLHPVLQRQLMSFLVKTSNQYFIATHSAHLIDALHANTFHVRLVNGETVVERAVTDAQRHRVCQDLGYRASDIVQSNCVVWVEGPSDRVYLRHWLSESDPHLSEDVHFSVMFYGGKLLSHLSAGETDTVEDGLADLIQLRLLNRHLAVVIDSDRKSADDTIRDTKARVRDEVNAHGGFVWITAGREIENYVSPKALAAAVDIVEPGRGTSVKSGQYEKALPSVKPNAKATVDKVKTAGEVSKGRANLDVLDLRQRIEELSDFIRKANGLTPRR